MPRDIFSVRDRVVVITGGLGQLGTEFRSACLAGGAKVAVLDCQEAGAHDAKDTLFLRADVTDKTSLREALVVIEQAWGPPHALINNAALDAPPGASAADNGPFEDFSEEHWDQVMKVNLKGMFLACQVFGTAMAKAGRGTILNISSIYGMVSPDQRLYEYRRRQGEEFYKPVAYSVSKSGVFNLTRYLATYWAPRNVRVNTLTFGGVFNDQHPEMLREYTARVPLGRMADKSEYNGAVLFLVSDASSYMTGANLVMDGGWTAW